MLRRTTHRTLKSELVLIVGFLAVLFVVPAVQIGLELLRGERVQSTDLFRYVPTEKNLRQYERNLEDVSWIQQAVRPEVQQVLLRVLGDPGAKAVLGRDGWLFYRPDIRYLVEPTGPEPGDPNSMWVEPERGTTLDSAVRTIVRFRDQLQERRIALLVVPVPGKPSIYPEMLSRRAGGSSAPVHSPTIELLERLEAEGVQTIDLFSLFVRLRGEGEPNGALYLERDTHWTPRGARRAAEAVAERVRALGWAPAERRQHEVKDVQVNRHSDIVEMMQIPGAEGQFPSELVQCEQVLELLGERRGLIVPADGERPGSHRDPAGKASVLVLGDSFCRIYQTAEPASLGDVVEDAGLARYGDGAQEAKGTKRLLPGSAGFISHLAMALKAPVDFIVSDGGAASAVRKSLSIHAEILEGKKVVIWEFVERDIALGSAGWEDVPLPASLDETSP